MNIIDEVEAIYTDLNNQYDAVIVTCNKRGHTQKKKLFERKRELNDMAYFLFLFTRLEDRIKELSDKLINTKASGLTIWENKRTWDVLVKRKNSIPLMDRVALLTEINKPDYNLIRQYYNQRNEIGHGGNFTIPINVPVFIADLKRLFKDLKL